MSLFSDYGIPSYTVTDAVARSALLFASTPEFGARAPVSYDPANGPVSIYSYVKDDGTLVETGEVGFGVCVVEITQDEIDRAIAAGDTLQLIVARHGHFISNGQLVVSDTLRVGGNPANEVDLAAIRATAATRENLLFSEHTLNQV